MNAINLEMVILYLAIDPHSYQSHVVIIFTNRQPEEEYQQNRDG